MEDERTHTHTYRVCTHTHTWFLQLYVSEGCKRITKDVFGVINLSYAIISLKDRFLEAILKLSPIVAGFASLSVVGELSQIRRKVICRSVYIEARA